ncbi:MAG: pitrilysin family protein [Gemmatimonadota bacterium]
MLTRCICVALLFVTTRVAAQDPGKVPVETYTLDNGLTVILSESHAAQIVSVNVWYAVGSRDEIPQHTGFAHLFEHMMFQGSAHVKRAEHLQLIERAGGGLNGSTETDRTSYFETLPSNRLNLGLWLEADRMRSLAVTDSNFTNQREAVKEERRLRVENRPYGAAIFEGPQDLFDPESCFPYSHSVIGSMDDLNAAGTEDLKAFFDQHYVPNRATLVVTGDFSPANARALIEQYFGDIPRGSKAAPVACSQPFNTGARRKKLHDPNASLPAVLLMYRTPAEDHPDVPALTLIGILLGQRESSRLNQRLVRETRAAVSAQAVPGIFGPRRGPNFFLAYAIASQGVHPDSLEALLTGELARLVEGNITDEEVAKARNAYRASVIHSRQTTMDLAEVLQYANLFLGTSEAINTDFARYMAVSRNDLIRVAKTYFRPDNSLTIVVTPPPAQPDGATP